MSNYRVPDLRGGGEMTGVLLAASRDPDAKLTFLVTRGEPTASGPSQIAVKIPVTCEAAAAVERESRMLVELRRMQLGPLRDLVPQYIESVEVEARTALVSTAMPGKPMSLGYHQFLHTARRRLVRTDLTLAGEWLRAFQGATTSGTAPLEWAREVSDALVSRWDGDPALGTALARLSQAQHDLDGRVTPRTAVHGDYWFGNLLVDGGAVSGVVDWENGDREGCPLRDLARFALSYSLYLDRHARPGRRVLGHRGLRRVGFGPGVRYALLHRGWLPSSVRDFLGAGLVDLGLPPWLWYDVALVGLAEVAAAANDEQFGHDHLLLLAGMPLRPRAHHRVSWSRSGGRRRPSRRGLVRSVLP